MVSSLH